MTDAKPHAVPEGPPALAGSEANIHQRMLAVVAGIGYIPKEGTGPQEQGSYRFARVEHIKDAIRDQHVRHGVMVHTDLDTSGPAYEVITGNNGKHAFVATVRGSLVFVNADKPEDRVTSPLIGMAVDYSDKAITKAITAAVKAALLNAYSIPTGADPDETAATLPDGRGASETGAASGGGTRSRPPAQRAPRPADGGYGGERSPFDDEGSYGPDGGPRQAAGPSGPGDRCPKHDRPWKSGQYGWFCSAKDEGEERGYCKQKPDKAWVAAHER